MVIGKYIWRYGFRQTERLNFIKRVKLTKFLVGRCRHAIMQRTTLTVSWANGKWSSLFLLGGYHHQGF
jgi:hypothetical protein